MSDNFEIQILYKNKKLEFPASLITTGYTYKIQVDVFDRIIFFEPDEERNFRAVIDHKDLSYEDKIDKALIKEIGEVLEEMFKG